MAVAMVTYNHKAHILGHKQASCRHAAATKPVVLLRGVNHAQLSNGALREGDLEPEAGRRGGHSRSRGRARRLCRRAHEP